MKVAYLGGTRGHQAAVYRPGVGWSGTDRHWRVRRQPRVLSKKRHFGMCPLTVAHRRRPGLATKTFIIFVIALVAIALTLVLTGSAGF